MAFVSLVATYEAGPCFSVWEFCVCQTWGYCSEFFSEVVCTVYSYYSFLGSVLKKTSFLEFWDFSYYVVISICMNIPVGGKWLTVFCAPVILGHFCTVYIKMGHFIGLAQTDPTRNMEGECLISDRSLLSHNFCDQPESSFYSNVMHILSKSWMFLLKFMKFV